VLFEGSIAGYTIGNDLSSRRIEGANPLYLPQAKVYDRCAAIGPCLATPATVGNPQALDVRLVIERGGKEVFAGSASMSRMKRTRAEIAERVQRHNPLPDGSVVMTGTGIVPPRDFTLAAGDVVSIEIERIGRLVNRVVV